MRRLGQHANLGLSLCIGENVVKKKSRALKYAGLGLPVIPLHTIVEGHCSCGDVDCTRPGKHPRTPHGVKDATTDRNQIKDWWGEWPDANIGLAPGRERDLLVLDIDPRHGGNKTLKQLKRKLGALPETVTAKTGGGGQHLFFRHPNFKVRKDTAGKLLGRGIDVLSDGCIVVAPPSRHASGRQYAWVEGKSFQDIEPANLPKAWRNRLRGDATNKSTRTNGKPETLGHISQGQRNNHLTRLAGGLQRSGLSPEAILAALGAENDAKCNPPLDVSEVKQIVESIARYPALGDGADAAEALMQIVLDRHFNGGKHLLRGTDGRFWHYAGRLWRVVTDDWVSGKTLKIIQANPAKGQKTAPLLSQVLTLLKAKLATENDRLAFVANPHPIIIAPTVNSGLGMMASFGCGPISQIHICATASTSNMTRRLNVPNMTGPFGKSSVRLTTPKRWSAIGMSWRGT
jgi:putative DNA primase/helicase